MVLFPINSHRRIIYGEFHIQAHLFLAYYGVATNNASFPREAVNQCLLYRQILQTNDHRIIYGEFHIH